MSMLDAMGLTLEEVARAEETVRVRPALRDGRICLCGHPVSRHIVAAGIVSCTLGRQTCPCKSVKPVIDVTDTRYFLKKTEGYGPLHALSRGVALLEEKGGSGDWIVTIECQNPNCAKTPNSRVIPVPVDGRVTPPRVATSATGYDLLLCTTCTDSM